tara:strand:- start:3860 stop:4414 length:555 start_codon:yes stop_codon:yes gene_type:complete
MTWFDVLKMYGDEDEYVPKEMLELLDENESLQYKYDSFMEDLNYDRYDLAQQMLEVAKKDNLGDYGMKAIEKYMNYEIEGSGTFDDVHEAITDEYYTKKRDAGDDDDDYVPPKQGNKNAKAVESMEQFYDQYYENPYSDPEENRELGAFIAGVSNGESMSDLERKYPAAYVVFDSAGLLNEVEE